LEMQQAHRSIRSELTWTTIAELPTASVAGYGFGLFVRQDLELGTVVAHSGGYPGFGSHMRWHPASGLGVIVLGNRTYYPALKVGEQMLRALVRAEVASSRRLRPAPVLERAREAAERLIAAWDDDLAAATFSMNVDLDEPLAVRRATFERLREVHGAFRRSDEPTVHDSPLHASWWLEAERGRIGVEITLDPQPEPKVQSLDVTSVPEPDPRVRDAAERLVGAVNADVPQGDAALIRTLVGSCALARPVTSGPAGATYRVTGERAELELAVTIDDESGELRSATWTPVPIRPPLFGVE
jgi:Beta-lactamase